MVAAFVACLLLVGEALASTSPARGNRPTIALDSSAIAKAKRITVRLRDLPPSNSQTTAWFINLQWKPGLVNRTGPLIYCRGRVADLSSITFRGGWSSRFDRAAGLRLWELTSAVAVLATPSQARHYFDTADAWTRRCLAKGATIGADHFTSLRRVRPPSVADQQAEFLIRKVSSRVPGRKLGTVIVLLRRGPTFIELTFDWGRVPVPASLVETVVKKVAARAR